MKKLIIALTLVFSGLLINGQESQDTPVPQVFPASPEAASLGKYGDIPVNLSTGRINHSIPLYTVNEAGFSLPISLSYNYSGLKVEEIPGMAGLGWDMVGKGMITRQIRGIPDEAPLGYIKGNIGKKVHQFHTNSLQMTDVEVLNFFKNSYQGIWDTESDKYMINVGSLSATFYLNHNGEAVFAPYKNYKLTRLPNSTAFELIDDSGIKYYFEQKETTEIEVVNQIASTVNLYTSAWVITRIELPNNKTISFEYEAYQLKQRTHSEMWTRVNADSPSFIECQAKPGLNIKLHGQTLNQTFGLLLKKINTPKEIVDFSYTILNPLHIAEGQNPVSLDAITIKNTVEQEVMKYTLEYNDKTQPKKLLTAIHRGKTNMAQQQNYYRFEYYGNPPNNIAYYKQDYWGYYNGSKNTTGSLLPENTNRYPDFNSTKIGALKKIYYPTKGYSEFTYEQNDVYGKLDTGEVGLEERLDTPVDIIITSDNYEDQDFILETIPVTFTPNEINGGEVYISLSYHLMASAPGATVRLELKRTDGQSIISCSQPGVLCNYRVNQADGEQTPGVPKVLPKTLFRLIPGEYKLEVYFERNGAPNNPPRAVANVHLQYYSGNVPVEPENTNVPFGGIRIKEINSCSELGDCTTKRYSYQEENNTHSSAISLYKPIFKNEEQHHYFIDDQNNGHSQVYCNVDRISSFSSIPLSTYIGSPILYKSVEEILIGDNNEELKTRYYFSGTPNAVEASPYPQTDTRDWRKGQLLKTEYLKKEGNSYAVSQKSTNNYSPLARDTGILSNQNSYNFKVGKIMFTYQDYGGSPILVPSQGIQEYKYVKYLFSSELYPIASSQKEEFYESSKFTQNSLYSYDNPYGQLKTQTTTDSDNKTLTTTYSYPYDKNSTVNNLLVAQNRITTPVETQSKENTTILGTQATEFIDWGNGIVLPGITKVAKGGDTPEPRLTYHKYDTQGNPLEVSQVDGRHIMYIWGYNDTQPIVKIDNASYTGIPAGVTTLINQLKTTSDTEDTAAEETTMRTLFKNLREHAYFAKAQISGYTYDPLIGVTSMTNPQGQTAYYRYDDMNRMQYALDQDQHVVQQVRYNYQGQQSDALGGVIIDTPGDQPKVPDQPATFTANTSGSGSANLYTWSVNGAQEQCGSGVSFTKTFTSEGTYEVKVLAYNTETKHRVSHTMSVIVKYPELTTPLVNANYTHIVKGTNVDFSASSIGGGTGNLRYEWYLNNVKQTSTTTTFRYNPNTAGTYNVYFKVIDNESGKSVNSAIRKLYAYHPLNTPNVSASKAHIERGTTTTFTASNIGGGSGSRRYEWYVNNVKQSATGTSYSYHFPTSGTYTIKFKVVDLTMQNANTKWGANSPVLKVYPKMVVSTSQSATSVSGSSASVSFNVTGISGGSGSRQITWRAFKTVSPSQTAGSGTGTQFSFSNFATGTHEYNITAKVKDNLTGKQVTRLMVVVSSISDEDCPNCGPQH